MKRLLTVAVLVLAIAIGARHLYGYFACGGGGLVWAKVGNVGLSGTVYLLFEPKAKVLYASSNSGSGFARSLDHGVTWGSFNTGNTSGCHFGMGFNDIGEVMSATLHNPGVPSCSGTDPHAAMRLIGNGTTWTMIPWPTAPQASQFLISFAVTGGTTLAAGSGVLFFSTDHGATWHNPTTPIPEPACGEKFQLVTSPGGNVSLDLANQSFGNNLCAPYYTTDGGNNWLVYPQGWPNGLTKLGDCGTFNLLANNFLLMTCEGTGQPKGWCYGPQPPPNGNWSACYTGINNGGKGFSYAIVTGTGTVFGYTQGNNGTGCGGWESKDNGVTWTEQIQGLPLTSGTPPCNTMDARGLAVDESNFIYTVNNATGDVFKTTTPQ